VACGSVCRRSPAGRELGRMSLSVERGNSVSVRACSVRVAKAVCKPEPNVPTVCGVCVCPKGHVTSKSKLVCFLLLLPQACCSWRVGRQRVQAWPSEAKRGRHAVPCSVWQSSAEFCGVHSKCEAVPGAGGK